MNELQRIQRTNTRLEEKEENINLDFSHDQQDLRAAESFMDEGSSVWGGVYKSSQKLFFKFEEIISSKMISSLETNSLFVLLAVCSLIVIFIVYYLSSMHNSNKTQFIIQNRIYNLISEYSHINQK